MLLLKVFILVVLLLIVVQDFRSRSVYWFLFPVLSVLFFIADLYLHRSFFDIGYTVICSCSFLLLQYFLVSLYFSIKNKRWVNITAQLLGWGDILLLLSLTFYLSLLNLIFFYVASLIGSLMTWLVWRVLAKNENKHVPLAGLQAIFLSIVFIVDWYWLHFNLSDDAWILSLSHK
jgi:hypothetical protein